ncbi:hypothetical protein ACQY0O_008047 [Thecaphora frezii]
MPSAVPNAVPDAKSSELDGATLRDDDNDDGSDAFSMLTTTTARLAMPVLAHQPYSAPEPVRAPFPPFLLHCTLFASYDGHPPHPDAFCNVGLPARYARGESAATHNRLSHSVSKLRKRLGVQLPLHYLDPDPATADVKALYFHPHPVDGRELMARRPSLARGRMFTLFQTMSPELTGLVSRPLVDRVLSALFFGTGIHQPMAVFPAEAVLTYGAKYRCTRNADGRGRGRGKLGWLKSLRPSNGSNRTADEAAPTAGIATAEASADATPSHVKVAMVYATLDLLPPPARLLEARGPYPKEMNKSSAADQECAVRIQVEASKMSDDERYAVFGWEQDQAERAAMMQMLAALERRGGIWTAAGRITMPSSRNPDPKERPRYLVKGLFPERWVNRCSWFRSKDHRPMPSDLSDESIGKFGCPIVVNTVEERLGRARTGTELRGGSYGAPAVAAAGVDQAGNPAEEEWDEGLPGLSTDVVHPSSPSPSSAGAGVGSGEITGFGIDSPHAEALLETEEDFFQGWSVGATLEPFKNGGYYESLAGASAGSFAVGAGG